VSVGLGTDGAASNNALDLFQDVKHLALMQKHATGDAAAMPATEAWAVATGQRAPLLGHSGRIAAGEPADFLLVHADAPELTPGDLTANLVYAASGSVVDTTVVAGRVLMRHGTTGDEGEVRDAALTSARRLGVIY
jgi:5-methylthioadenosine/S-adenosylhomocysteine deaminase